MEQVRAHCKMHGICNTGRCKGMTTDHLPLCFVHLDPPAMPIRSEKKPCKCDAQDGTGSGSSR